MKVTLNWLKEFLDFQGKKIDPEEIAHLLTMSGTEVKKIEDVGSKYKNMVVGKIVDFSQHPDADKLSVCKVDINNNVLNIVCGAKNFKKNDKVVLALEGAVTAQGLKIRKTQLRGVLSEGMMCSESELGLSTESEGIMILDNSFKLGESFASQVGLDDIVYELEITPNRPDCLSIAGIAREIGVIKKVKFIYPDFECLDEINIDSDLAIDIRDFNLCPRYSAKIFSNIPYKETPLWLKNRLILCDYRPVNLIVDITNYVMHEIGQPLHAFDKDLLYSNKIIVRNALKDEDILCIDNNIRKLNENMLVIADEKRPIAIAGIIGGKETEINENTKNVILESANFFGPSILKTSKELGFRTEASNRFEKKLDPEMTITAIKKFERLLSDITQVNFKKGIYDNYKKTKRTRQIKVSLVNVANILGKAISPSEISETLTALGIKNNFIDLKNEIILAEVPSVRYEDLEREIDIIEEIARIHGFENFQSKPPATFILKGGRSYTQSIIKNIKNILTDIGLDEVINYSFLSEQWHKKLKLDLEDDFNSPVKIINPINEDFYLLRTTPLPSMIKNLILNLNKGIKDIKIFEVTKIYRENNNKNNKAVVDEEYKNYNKYSSDLSVLESNVLSILLSGRLNLKSWNALEKYCDYYDLKGIFEYLIDKLGIDYNLIEIFKSSYRFFHPTINAAIKAKDSKLGFVGKINPLIMDSLDVSQDVFYMELYIDELLNFIQHQKVFKPIPQFPPIEIDVAVVVDDDISHNDLEQEIKSTDKNLLKEVRLFDIYKGPQIEPSKKSMAYRLVFRDDSRTLKDEEVEIIVQTILENLKKKFKAKLRE